MTITFRSPIRIRLTAKGRRQISGLLFRLAGILALVAAVAGMLAATTIAVPALVVALAAGIQAARLGIARKTTTRWSRTTGNTTVRRTFR